MDVWGDLWGCSKVSEAMVLQTNSLNLGMVHGFAYVDFDEVWRYDSESVLVPSSSVPMRILCLICM